jgi:hypothetical protein
MITSPIQQQPSPILRGVLQAAQPNRLFAAGEQGVWFDPSDFSTLFQDSAGTTPVTAVGQPVGLMLDKSGRGNHATQATAGKRPILEVDTSGRYYLKGDSTAGRTMLTSTVTPGIDKAQVFAGVRKLSDAAFQTIVNNGDPNTTQFRFAVGSSTALNDALRRTWAFSTRGNANEQLLKALGLHAAPQTAVLCGLFDNAQATNSNKVLARRNGVQEAPFGEQGVFVGTGNYVAAPIGLFAYGGTANYFTGHIYGLIVRFGPNLNAVTIMEMERYMAGKTGISIS